MKARAILGLSRFTPSLHFDRIRQVPVLRSHGAQRLVACAGFCLMRLATETHKMSKDTGGPAFPTVDANREEDYGTRGMSLRDYFAAKAMHGLIEGALASDADFPHRDNVAVRAYAYADAMLAARVKP